MATQFHARVSKAIEDIGKRRRCVSTNILLDASMDHPDCEVAPRHMKALANHIGQSEKIDQQIALVCCCITVASPIRALQIGQHTRLVECVIQVFWHFSAPNVRPHAALAISTIIQAIFNAVVNKRAIKCPGKSPWELFGERVVQLLGGFEKAVEIAVEMATNRDFSNKRHGEIAQIKEAATVVLYAVGDPDPLKLADALKVYNDTTFDRLLACIHDPRVEKVWHSGIVPSLSSLISAVRIVNCMK